MENTVPPTKTASEVIALRAPALSGDSREPALIVLADELLGNKVPVGGFREYAKALQVPRLTSEVKRLRPEVAVIEFEAVDYPGTPMRFTRGPIEFSYRCAAVVVVIARDRAIGQYAVQHVQGGRGR